MAVSSIGDSTNWRKTPFGGSHRLTEKENMTDTHASCLETVLRYTDKYRMGNGYVIPKVMYNAAEGKGFLPILMLYLNPGSGGAGWKGKEVREGVEKRGEYFTLTLSPTNDFFFSWIIF